MKNKKIMTFIMSTVLTVSMATCAFAADADAEWNSDTGVDIRVADTSVRQPVMEVQLPGDLAFQVDPLLIENDAQITGGDYNVVNLGDTAVLVNVQPQINLGDGSEIEVKDTATLDAKTNTYADLTSTDGKKAVYMIAIAADKAAALKDGNKDGVYEFTYKANATNIGMTENTVTETTSTVTYAKGDVTDAPVVLGSAPSADKSFSFELEAATYTDDALTSAGSVSSFTLVGAVDPHKTYAEGEVAVKATYKMTLQTKNELTTATKGKTEGKQRIFK